MCIHHMQIHMHMFTSRQVRNHSESMSFLFSEVLRCRDCRPLRAPGLKVCGANCFHVTRKIQLQSNSKVYLQYTIRRYSCLPCIIRYSSSTCESSRHWYTLLLIHVCIFIRLYENMFHGGLCFFLATSLWKDLVQQGLVLKWMRP